MKDNKLELRQNNFMKVSFDILKVREDHNLNLRKTKNDDIITKKRKLKQKEAASEFEIDQTKLNIDDNLKNFSINDMVLLNV
jgi:predicted XRE-type DNA-binding protein